jgi:general secretion pathway protein G
MRARPFGFTLIELVITVAIVAVLASVALPLTELTVQRAKEQDLRRALRDIREALDAYKQAGDEGRIRRKVGDSGYPPRIGALVEGVEDQKSPERRRIYFLRRIPPDPFGDEWGLRSYASPPDDPSEGDDVYDVYSRSRRVGLDGRLYRQW